MKIKSVRIQNFRTFKDETIFFNDYTCLVGANGAGKSTILCALNIFFQETENSSTDLKLLSEEDFHKKNTEEPIKITVTFNDLEGEAQKDFKEYYRQGELIISAYASFDEIKRNAPVKQYGQRNVMKIFSDFFKALGDNRQVKELKSIYETITKSYPELIKNGTKEQMAESLRSYENSHPELCEIMPSQDEFYGVSKGKNLLNKYIQWVYVPAVKDASTEQIEAKNTAFGKLIERTVRTKVNFEPIESLRLRTQEDYKKLLEKANPLLKEISESLGKRLTDWAHPGATLDLEWSKDDENAIKIDEPLAKIITGESGFKGELSRFGHGLQRSYLLALLQELAESDKESSPRLILGCEEPELYQHPLQAKHLSTVMRKLSQNNSQIIISTHSPYFISGQYFEDIRLIKKNIKNLESSVKMAKFDKIAQDISKVSGTPVIKPEGIRVKIHQELQPSINEIFFSPIVILVEGLEDVAYITAHLQLSEKWEEFRHMGCQIIPANGKNHMPHLLAIMNQIEIPYFVVFDSDGNEVNIQNRDKHKKDNETILKMCGIVNPQPFPSEDVLGDNFVIWKNEIKDSTFKEIKPEELLPIEEKARLTCGQIGGIDKNSMYITELLTSAWEKGIKSSTLEKLGESILSFSRKLSVVKS